MNVKERVKCPECWAEWDADGEETVWCPECGFPLHAPSESASLTTKITWFRNEADKYAYRARGYGSGPEDFWRGKSQGYHEAYLMHLDAKYGDGDMNEDLREALETTNQPEQETENDSYNRGRVEALQDVEGWTRSSRIKSTV